jgi:hypothetical protein
MEAAGESVRELVEAAERLLRRSLRALRQRLALQALVPRREYAA